MIKIQTTKIFYLKFFINKKNVIKRNMFYIFLCSRANDMHIWNDYKSFEHIGLFKSFNERSLFQMHANDINQ